MMAFSFEGKRVLVTGGAGGLGTAVVQKFIENGATVYALDCDEEALEKLKSNLPTVQTILVDLSNWNETRKAVEGLCPLDHLVNSAGVLTSEFKDIVDVSEESLDWVMSINFKASFNVSQVFSKNVIANSIKGATIVNVSSTASIVHQVRISPYECSKAAVNMMRKAFAVEMGPHGIRVNCILPTAMPTNMMKNVNQNSSDKIVDKCMGKAPISEMLQTADAANLILYLSSDLSQMITGTNIPIDGGILSVL